MENIADCQVIICKNSENYIKVCDLCLAQADDSMPIKRDYLRNKQLNISTNMLEVINLCQAQVTNFVSLYLHIRLIIYNISHTRVIFHIFGIERSIQF